MQPKRILMKLGGAALSQESAMELAAGAIKKYQDMSCEIIVVHGGGPAINAQLNKLGITWEFVGGQRVTSVAMMDVIEAVLCGSVNKKLVRYFNQAGLRTVGFSGIDNQTLICEQASPELGLVGKIKHVNSGWIEELVQAMPNLIPIIAPVGVGMNGQAYNINADLAASHLAVALGVDRLLFVTDQKGILDEEGELISSVTSDGLENMIQCRIVSGGMLVKSRAILHALKSGISTVAVMNAADALRDLRGTVCTLSKALPRNLSEQSYASV